MKTTRAMPSVVPLSCGGVNDIKYQERKGVGMAEQLMGYDSPS